MIHRGRCHCGAIETRFTTEKALEPRACDCSFCRRHDARSVSDPGGSAEIRIGGDVIRYRFESRSADYLLCATCGVYVGAVAMIEGRLYATLNLNAFEPSHPELAAVPVSYDGESVEAKAIRRRRKWTPAKIVEA